MNTLRQLIAKHMNSQTIQVDLGDDYLPAPVLPLSYELTKVPQGPGTLQLRSILDLLPPLDLKKGPWIAGGAPRRLLQKESLEAGDIDFFFSSAESWKSFCGVLDNHQVIIKTNRATTYLVNGFKVQCIRRRYYSDLEQIFKDFDFSACQIATDGQYLVSTKQAFEDIENQVLRLAPCGTIAKRTLVQRMSKYVNHGLIPEPGLFEIVVKSGLDYVGAYSIFSDTDVAIYDEFSGEEAEEIISAEDLDADIMRTIARKLGLEKADD